MDPDNDVMGTFDRETAVLYWHHRPGEEAPDLDPELLRRALREAYGAGWRLAMYCHEVHQNPAPPFPPA